MPTPFLSSEEYDERAHQLYNEGQYDEALSVLREGLALYPTSVELHIGVGYARLAREEFAWARRSFEESLVLEPEHEDALAGLGETLLKFGLEDAALRCFHRTLELGYADEPHFWRVFKKHYGVAPGGWLSLYRANDRLNGRPQ
jgi:tetratricopeptide (TPR) repeat protein